MTTIRPAVLSDSAFVYKLSMDPAIREASTRSDEFTFADHEIWWIGKLTDGKNAVWIMEDEIPVGQVRYGRTESGEAEVAISVTPTYWGNGYASELLTTTMTMACDWLKVRTLVALILRDNDRSRRLFLKAGFIYAGREQRFGKEHLRYEWEKE